MPVQYMHRHRFLVSGVGLCYLFGAVPEKHRSAPDRGKGYENVDYPAQYGCRAAEEPRHKIKFKQPDQSPVKTADYRQSKGKFIQKFHVITSFVYSMFRFRGFIQLMQVKLQV